MSDTPPEAVIDPRELRNALGAFMTGVTVVTTLDGDGNPRGLTANSFTSVSLDPPLVLFCIAKNAFSCPLFAGAARFAINILTEEQRDVSSTFASKIEDRFATVDWRPGQTGSPVLTGAAAWLDCRMHDQVDAGDHLILIGRVVAFDYSSANPLGFAAATTSAPGWSRRPSTGRGRPPASARSSRATDACC